MYAFENSAEEYSQLITYKIILLVSIDRLPDHEFVSNEKLNEPYKQVNV